MGWNVIYCDLVYKFHPGFHLGGVPSAGHRPRSNLLRVSKVKWVSRGALVICASERLTRFTLDSLKTRF